MTDSLSSLSSMSEDEDEDINLRLDEFDTALSSNTFNYDAHVGKIKILRSSGDLDALRLARETFAKHYPLSPSLWLDWLRDESKLAVNQEEIESVIRLFERAVVDYVSVDVWLEYCTFIQSPQNDSDFATIRDVFERAIVAVGLNIARGAEIWSAYRKFERAYNTGIELSLYKRELSIPLKNMSDTFAEYSAVCQVDDLLRTKYEAACVELNKRQTYEELIANTSSNCSYAVLYEPYLKFEICLKETARIQSLFERAITECCLEPQVWLDYIAYLDTTLRIQSISMAVHGRAIRNCPWSVAIWIAQLRALERYDLPRSEMVTCVEQALAVGFYNPKVDNVEIWMAFLDCMRRTTKLSPLCAKGDTVEMTEDMLHLRKCFSRAYYACSEYFSKVKLTNDDFRIAKYWAFVEACMFDDMPSARNIWKDILEACPGHSSLWLEYINLERRYGTVNHTRKIFGRAVERLTDSHQTTVADAWIGFEREEGTLKSLETCECQLKKIMLAKVKPVVTESLKRKAHCVEDENSKAQFKVPKRMKKSEDSSKALSQKDEIKVVGDVQSRTVFLSNLGFNISPNLVRQSMEKSGHLIDLRLSTKGGGSGKLLKGFGYAEFSRPSEAKHALSRDHELLQGRPMFISPYRESAVQSIKSFKYNVCLEPKKLFVKNLNFDTSVDDLRKLFGQYGSLIDVRLVTYRNGNSKGMAFIEYEDEKEASRAVLSIDNILFMDHHISVAISNPPVRNQRRGDGEENIKKFQKKSLMINDDDGGVNSQSTKSSASQNTPLSNDDFRKLLFTKRKT